ncbi:MAG: 2-amino-4-hydroxy-6-hydroxymethyldihydropteridine diphosphokinase [Candidatus Omnitrophota bacterium]
MAQYTRTAVAYLALGSNKGDRKYNCRYAVNCLMDLDKVVVLEESSFYLTRPVGGPLQEEYLNGVVKIETSLLPVELLHGAKNIEKQMGRKPAPRNYPRIIDIDILLYGDIAIKEEGISIPHSRMHERHFVLKGLYEIAPDVVHPVLNKTVRELCETVNNGC